MLSGFDKLPTEENSKTDKIRVKLGTWTVSYSNEDQLEDFIIALQPFPGWNPIENIDATPLGEDGQFAQFGWIFTGRKDRGNRTTLKIREKDRRAFGRRPGFPLFKGSLRISRVGSVAAQKKLIAFIEADLFINPTRFASYQAPWGDQPIRIWSDSVRRRRLRPPPLDGNDNLLLRTAEKYFSKPKRWNRIVKKYWHEIRRCLDSEFKRAIWNATGDPHLSFSPRVDPLEIEVYWEVEAKGAIKRLKDIAPLISSRGRRAAISEYPSLVRDRIINCPSLSVHIKSGLELRVYAKTEERLRFEFAFNLRKYRIKGGRISEKFNSLPRLCKTLAKDEASRMAELFEEIAEADEDSDSPSFQEFLGNVLDASETTADAKMILNLLIENRGITPTDRKLKKVIDRLKRRGVLKGSSIQGAAILTPKYQRCVAKLF